MLKEAIGLAGHGLAIHWLHNKSKKPIGKEWASVPVMDADELTRRYREGMNVGVRLGKWSKVHGYFLHILDIDVRKPEVEVDALRKLREILPELDLATIPTVRSGAGGASRHGYILSDKSFPSRKFAHSAGFEMVWNEELGREVKKWDWELHLLGSGAQAVIPPSIHPDTGRHYTWEREFNWLDLDLGMADILPSAALERLIGYEDGEAVDPKRAEPLGMSIDEIRTTLADLPIDEWVDDRDGWFRVGMAIHHETGGSDEGYELWCQHAARTTRTLGNGDSLYNEADQKRVWKSFKNRTGRPFRMASLNAVARDVQIMRDFEDQDEREQDDLESEFEDEGGAAPPDIFADLLGETPEAERPKFKPTPSQVRLAKAEVEAALGVEVPAFVKRFNQRHAIARVSSKTVIMDFQPDGRVTYGGVGDLHNFYENERKPLGGTTVPISKIWIQHKARRQYPNGIIFAPGREVEGAYNHWQGFSVTPSEARDPSRGCRLILDHLRNVICSGNEEYFRYMLGWAAHMVQQPEDKPGVALVLVGKKRIGKDTFFEYLGKLIANHYITIASQDQMTGKFNQHQEKCLLLHAQEGFWAGNKQAEGMLKYLITSTSVMIEPKGMNAFPIPSVLRLVISSNERWVVPATEDEGRFFILSVSEKRRNDHAYFALLRDEMNGDGPAALLAFLKSYDISNFQVRAVPDTAALGEQKLQGLKNVERWWMDVLQRGELAGIANHGPAGKGALWAESTMLVERRDVRHDYSNWMRGRRYDGEETSETEFGQRLHRLCPSIVNKRIQRTNLKGLYYDIPDLHICRKEFEEYLGSKLEWPEDNDVVIEDKVDL